MKITVSLDSGIQQRMRHVRRVIAEQQERKQSAETTDAQLRDIMQVPAKQGKGTTVTAPMLKQFIIDHSICDPSTQRPMRKGSKKAELVTAVLCWWQEQQEDAGGEPAAQLLADQPQKVVARGPSLEEEEEDAAAMAYEQEVDQQMQQEERQRAHAALQQLLLEAEIGADGGSEGGDDEDSEGEADCIPGHG